MSPRWCLHIIMVWYQCGHQILRLQWEMQLKFSVRFSSFRRLVVTAMHCYLQCKLEHCWLPHQLSWECGLFIEPWFFGITMVTNRLCQCPRFSQQFVPDLTGVIWMLLEPDFSLLWKINYKLFETRYSAAKALHQCSVLHIHILWVLHFSTSWTK